MKRYVTTSSYVNNTIVFDDILIIDINIPISKYIVATTASRFPGIDIFKQDILSMLEDDYGFEVIEDTYDGVKQKGYTSNRQDSTSIYFDTYYNLKNSMDALHRRGRTNIDLSNLGDIYCFIHIRVSDHELNDYGDDLHRNFIRQNEQKYTYRRSDIQRSYPDVSIYVPEYIMHRYYEEALAEIRDSLDERIVTWVNTALRRQNLDLR